MRRSSQILLSAIVVLAAPLAAVAQPLGTFRWQLQPYCNIVSVVVTQTSGVYQLAGTDDQCGGDQASVVGTAFPNPDGSIGFGLNIVAVPSGMPIHVEADLTLPTLSGTWRDNAGHTGPFVFTPGAGNGGSPRPSTGTIGALAINPAEVQLRIGGGCPADQFMRVINENGSVTCAAAPAGGSGDVTGVTAGVGLTGGGTSGDVAIGIPLTVAGAFNFTNANGLTSAGTAGLGNLAVTGGGTRLVWYPGKAAFRAGQVAGAAWDDANIGLHSFAFGYDSTASGQYSAAFGAYTLANYFASTAMGQQSVASGFASTGMGLRSIASGHVSSAMGQDSVASGYASTAMGLHTTASGAYSTAMGSLSVASGEESTAMGAHSVASGAASVAAGNAASAAGLSAIAMGSNVYAGGKNSVALGSFATAIAAANGAFIFGDTSTTTPIVAYEPNQFIVRAAGGVGFYTNAALTSGSWIPPGASSWSTISDRNRKEHFRDLSGEEVLRKLARMPVQEWNYKAQDDAIRHVGPMAQDFYAAFGLGEDPLRINTIDADGIALAAIRALEARTAELMRENERLRKRLERLERRSSRQP